MIIPNKYFLENKRFKESINSSDNELDKRMYSLARDYNSYVRLNKGKWLRDIVDNSEKIIEQRKKKKIRKAVIILGSVLSVVISFGLCVLVCNYMSAS